MDSTPSTAAAAKAAKSAPLPANHARSEVRNEVRNDLRNSVRSGAANQHHASGFGLPCSNCRLYYSADLNACPACNSKERVSPTVAPAIPKVQTVEPAPVLDAAVVDHEREAFLKQFKAQLVTTHAEITNTPTVCSRTEHHAQGAGAASICKPCYDHLQERLDVCEAALHIDLKEAAQIIYDAVWADPSDPSKTYRNAASALLSELRKRSGVSSMRGPFQPLDN
jgi:hypothetical protein